MTEKTEEIIQFKIMFIICLILIGIGYKLGTMHNVNTQIPCPPCSQQHNNENVQGINGALTLKRRF